jgi:hypothetical protein
MNFLNWISVACVLAFVSTPFSPQKQDAKLARIVPKQMHAQFSQGDSAKAWTDHLDSPANKKVYILSLEPDLDVGRHVIGVDLVLRDADEPKTNENLLSPAKNWHGLQPYNFVASDLLSGADRSVFGARRSIKITSRELDIEIQIVDVKLTALPDGTREIDELKLAVSANNLPNS